MVLALIAAGCASTGRSLGTRSQARQMHFFFQRGMAPDARRARASKLKHIIVITQENRSFDSLFGTFPGVHGLKHAKHTCNPDGAGHCIKPFHTNYDISAGGPHGYRAAPKDVNGGKMNGFVKTAIQLHHHQCVTQPHANICHLVRARQVMGYYDKREIPNYWRYAHRFALADRFFEASNDWSFPSHLYELSGWAAHCADHSPMSCRRSRSFNQEMHNSKLILAWTDITYLLHAYDVSWRYYVQPGPQPDCENSQAETCPLPKQYPTKGSIWNPLPQFDTVKQDGQLGDIQGVSEYYRDAKNGTLPSVSWVVPNQQHSEHSPARESDGQAFVTHLIDAAMASPDWNSTAIFLTWDDWGGLYDNMKPPRVDAYGYGMRVPLLIISPYAKAHFIYDQRSSSDAILKLIEDRFLNGARLNPRTDGRPDRRPDVRENQKNLGNLLNAFNFHQQPIAPFWLRQRPHTDFREPRRYPSAARSCTGLCNRVATHPLTVFGGGSA